MNDSFKKSRDLKSFASVLENKEHSQSMPSGQSIEKNSAASGIDFVEKKHLPPIAKRYLAILFASVCVIFFTYISLWFVMI